MRQSIETAPSNFDEEAEDDDYHYGFQLILSNDEETWIGRYREPKNKSGQLKAGWIDPDGQPLGFTPLYWEPFKT